jgi:hypothetical protein
MESEIGNPVTYQPEPLKPIDARQDPPPPPPASQQEEESSPIDDFYYDYQPPPPMYPQQFMPTEEKQKFDFASVDRMTMILLFTAFILGFFMGKTQTIQPMILRYS